MFNEEYKTSDILQDLKELRNFNGNETEFLNQYLKSLTLLSKASAGIISSFDEDLDKFEIIKLQGIEKETLGNNRQIYQSLVRTSKRSLSNEYSFENIKYFQNSMYIISFVIEISKRYVLSLFVNLHKNQKIDEIIIRTQLVSDIYSSYLANKKNQNYPLVNKHKGSEFDTQELKRIIEIIDLLNSEDIFEKAVLTFVNEICSKYNLSSVSYGLKENDNIKLMAISHLESFDKKQNIVDKLTGVFEEALDQNEDILYPSKNDNLITFSHNHYLKYKSLTSLLTFIIRVDKKNIGVLCLEKNDTSFSYKEFINLRLLINLSATTLNTLYVKNLSFPKKIIQNFKEQKNTKQLNIKKFFLGLSSLFIIFSFFEVFTYNIKSNASLSTNSIHIVSAPFDGVVNNVNYDISDNVKKEEILLTFDTKELLLKEIEEEANIIRHKVDIQKYRALNKLAMMKASSAKLSQTRARLEKIKYYLEQSNVKSLVEGTIIKGDRKNLFGLPVKKASILFEILEKSSLYLTIELEELYVDDINEIKKGEFILLSKPDEVFIFEIDKIIPMAKVNKNNKNIFLIKSKPFKNSKEWWKPGMSAVAKISLEKKSLFWILTHKLTNYIRIQFWI